MSRETILLEAINRKLDAILESQTAMLADLARMKDYTPEVKDNLQGGKGLYGEPSDDSPSLSKPSLKLL